MSYWWRRSIGAAWTAGTWTTWSRIFKGNSAATFCKGRNSLPKGRGTTHRAVSGSSVSASPCPSDTPTTSFWGSCWTRSLSSRQRPCWASRMGDTSFWPPAWGCSWRGGSCCVFASPSSISTPAPSSSPLPSAVSSNSRSLPL